MISTGDDPQCQVYPLGQQQVCGRDHGFLCGNMIEHLILAVIHINCGIPADMGPGYHFQNLARGNPQARGQARGPLENMVEGGFGEHSEVAFFNGEYYELASNNWMEYGNLYETIYLYPEYIDSTGTFMDGACMIALDVTVESKDATNQQKNSNTGEIETRYGNPYIFKADSLLYDLDGGLICQLSVVLQFACQY